MQSILGNSRKPDIIFYRNGRIEIASNVAKILNLSHGDVLDIMIDKPEYYLYVKYRADEKVGKHESTIFPTNKGNHYRTSSCKLCSTILNECGISDKSDKAKLCVGEPIHDSQYGVLLPIITQLLL